MSVMSAGSDNGERFERSCVEGAEIGTITEHLTSRVDRRIDGSEVEFAASEEHFCATEHEGGERVLQSSIDLS